VLGQALGCQVEQVERAPSPYHSSFPLEELQVRLANGGRLAVMFKDLSPGVQQAPARSIKPEFLYDPRREIEAYQAILTQAGLGTPAYYGAVVEPQIGRYWLFLEKVQGVELYQVGRFDIWRQVATWLAEMHLRLAEVGARARQTCALPLVKYDAEFYRLWANRALEFVRESATRERIERLVLSYEQVIERLLALPSTFIHGEFYASNVLVAKTQGRLRVCPVDWEMAAWAPGLVDLAALIAGKWTEGEKQTLAMDYHATVTGARYKSSDVNEFLADLRYCRLHLAVQWLGWAPNWTPPPEHKQDWLGEALHLADELGL
jgi:aminoglycoside phosphotransferase (APT) family kinase protein